MDSSRTSGPTPAAQPALRRSRRQFLRNAALLIGGTTLAACGAAPSVAPAPTMQSGGAATNATAPAAAASTDKKTFTVWYWGGDVFQKQADAFNAAFPSLFAKFENIPQADLHKKLLTSIAAGGGLPDVAAIEVSGIGKFTAKGGLVDLLQAPYNAGQYKDDFVAYKWGHGSSTDGKLLAMPWDCGAAGIFYRADLFEQAGLETDPAKLQTKIKTWDDWFALGDQFKAKLPNVGFFTDSYVDVFSTMVEQQGHGWFNGNKVLFEEKGLVPLQTAAAAQARGLDTKLEFWSPEWANALKKGDIASLAIGCWAQGFISNDHPETIGKWRVLRAPTGDFNWGGSFLTIPEGATNKAEAWEFIKWICATPEGQNGLFKLAGVLPAYKPAWNDPVYDEPVAFFGGQKAYRIWTEVASNVPSSTLSASDEQAADIINNEVTKVRKEGKAPAQAVQDAEAAAVERIKGVTA